MKRVPDRKKLRLEYLWKKGTAYGGIAVLVPIIAMVCIVAVIAFVVSLVSFARLHTLSFIRPLLVPLSIVAPFGIGYFIMRFGGGRVIDLHEQAKSIPYVPPASLDILPAEEVLVRGAQEPSTPSETLLRATVKDEETRAEELLRSSWGG